jgi:hypothetical protein
MLGRYGLAQIREPKVGGMTGDGSFLAPRPPSREGRGLSCQSYRTHMAPSRDASLQLWSIPSPVQSRMDADRSN